MDVFGINPFSGQAYNAIAMTQAINFYPNMFGRVGELGLFREVGVPTTAVALERLNNLVNLLPSRPRGSEPTLGAGPKRELRYVDIPHFPHNLTVKPEDVQNIRAFGSSTALETGANVMNLKLQTAARKHAITLEWLRINALQGVILDADGSTVILNLFTEFNITPYVQNFQFTSGTLDVMGLLYTVANWIETHLFGETMTRIYCLCSPGFFSKLTSHPNVQKAFTYFQTAQNLSTDVRKGFMFGPVIFEQYLGQASDASGTNHKFIPDNQAVFFPLGTQETFYTYFAPADYMEAVNTEGLPMYAKQEPIRFNKGWEIETQMNPLPVCRRPELLVTATVS